MKKNGFTLIELVVVLALFMLIISVTVGIFISVIQHQKRVLSQQDLLGQLSYAQEYMSRTLRSAVKDTSGNCLVNGENAHSGYTYLLTHYNIELDAYEGIRFITKDNTCQEFFRDSGDGLLKEIKDGALPQNLVSDTFIMSSVKFIINGNSTLQGAGEDNGIQPRVTMALNVDGKAMNGKNQIFQTTISQRDLNIP